MGSIEQSQPDYDVLIIGAGLSGCYASYRMQQMGVKFKVLETGTAVGGTWYWSESPQLPNYSKRMNSGQIHVIRKLARRQHASQATEKPIEAHQ